LSQSPLGLGIVLSEHNVDVVRTLYREAAHGDASGLQWLDERMALMQAARPAIRYLDDSCVACMDLPAAGSDLLATHGRASLDPAPEF
jgi:hypothetical protein